MPRPQSPHDDDLVAMLANVTGGVTPWRLRRLAEVLAFHPGAVLVECSDEKTGQRFGRAKCRRGRASKIGGGGRRTGAHAYQVWAVW